MLSWFAREEVKPDMVHPSHPGAFPLLEPAATLRRQRRQREWEVIYGPGSTAPEFGPPASPAPMSMRGMGSVRAMMGEMTWQQQWEAIYGPDTPLPTLFCPNDPRGGMARPSRPKPEIVARVSPLSSRTAAEVGAVAVGNEETTGLRMGRKRANAMSAGSVYMARVEASRSQSGAQHRHVPSPPPAPSNTTRLTNNLARARNGERAARLERQRREERRERVRREVGGMRIEGHDYGGEGEERARERERREGVWVGPVFEEGGSGEQGVGLRGGGCAMSLIRWLGEEGKGRECGGG